MNLSGFRLFNQIFVSSGLHSRRVITVTHGSPSVIFESFLVSPKFFLCDY